MGNKRELLTQDGDVLVSVCCITYNHKPYIRQCLDGFMMQKTTFPFEVLVHDDASTDGTADIIREYESKYPNIIKPIYQKENQYSKGIRISPTFQYPRAKGKYIALCEGDDYWIDPYKLQKQVDFLEGHPEYGLCYARARLFKQCEHKFGRVIGSYRSGFQDFLENGGGIATLTVVFHKKFLKGYNEFVQGQTWLMGDAPLWLYISYYSKIFFLDEVVAVYRELENSASARNSYNKRKEFIDSSYEVRFFFAEKCKCLESVELLRNKHALSLFDNAVGFDISKDVVKYFKLVSERNWRINLKYLLYRTRLLWLARLFKKKN